MSSPIVDVLSLLGVFAFAISGALVGVRRRLDLLGVAVVGIATGVGGGILRDLLLGVHPPVSFVYWPNLTVAAAAALIVFFFHPSIERNRRVEIVFDACGMGLFSATGAAFALDQGQPALGAVLVGVVTAIGGGVIRDVLVNEVPQVLTRELYAVSALTGSVTAVAIAAGTGNVVLAATVGGVLAVGLRLLSRWYGWHLPKPGPGIGAGAGDRAGRRG